MKPWVSCLNSSTLCERPLLVPRFGRSHVVVDKSGFYQPHEAGAPAAILGAADRAGDLVDLVAWHPDQPGRWWVRTGAAAVLGEAEIDRAACLDIPLYLVETPHAWLFNHSPGGRWPAACIIDWSTDPRPLFSGVRLVCHSNRLARRLEEAQRRYDRPLKIAIARSMAHAA